MKPESMLPGHGIRPSPRILVVDDEPEIRRLSSKLLTLSGCQVDSAEDGASAWDMLQLNLYDLLLTDHNMPRLTGMGLVKKLHAARMALPVILVSGKVPFEDKEWQRWLPIEAILAKPFTGIELLNIVGKVLSGKGILENGNQAPHRCGFVAR